jgi:hypothetical protein
MTFPVGTTFHPTFLYEALWNLAGIALLVYLDRRLRLGYGRVFALYVMIYTVGRGWIETLRIDIIELDDVLGLRWGVWMSIILFIGAAAYFLVAGRRHAPPHTREPSPYVEPRRTGPEAGSEDGPEEGAEGGADGSSEESREDPPLHAPEDADSTHAAGADEAESPEVPPRSHTPPE